MNRKKSASLQYWVYAILNKNFGTEVKIDRGSWCSRSVVNRHDFDVTTNTIPLTTVEQRLKSLLVSCGYKPDVNCNGAYIKNKNHIHMSHVRTYTDNLRISTHSYD